MDKNYMRITYEEDLQFWKVELKNAIREFEEFGKSILYSVENCREMVKKFEKALKELEMN
jgi:hypothetical protein